MVTKNELATAYYDNVRSAQIGGISPSEAKDLGYETSEDMARILGNFGGVAATSEIEIPEAVGVKIPDGLRQLPQVAIDAIAAARANRPDTSTQPQVQAPGYVVHALRGLVVDGRKRGKR
jgi:hypothetical protein